MSGVSVAIGAGTLLGGLFGSSSAKKAAQAQAAASKYAADVQERMFNQQRADYEPWRQTGMRALPELERLGSELNRNFSMSDFQADPGYQFRMDEAMKAIERSAAARGGRSGTRALNQMTRYSQDLASQEYGNAFNRFQTQGANRFNRLASLAGIGQQATSEMANIGSNYANNMGNIAMQGANARSAGTIAQGNILNNTIGSGINNWMQYQMMNRLTGNNLLGTGGTTGTIPSVPTSYNSQYLGLID